MRSRALSDLPLLSKGKEALFLLAPNYEPRSVLGMPELISSIRMLGRQARVEIWTLQARQHRVEPLEYLKTINVDAVRRLLKDVSGVITSSQTIPYPEVTENYISSMLAAAVDPLSDESCVVIDISTLPRRMIVALLKSAFGLVRRKRIGHLLFLYAWAQGYPRTPYAAEEGELKVMETDRMLSDTINPRSRVYSAIFCGRQGFDAKQLLETLPPNAEADIYVLINRYDLRSSLQMIRSNSTVINLGGSYRTNFYLSMQSAHEMLMERAESYYPSLGDIFLIAPFGPKPLTVTTFCALEKIRIKARQVSNFEAGTVALTGHQYNTTYSLGFSRWDLLELEAHDMQPEGEA